MTCRRRLLKEWKRLQVDDDSSYIVHVNEDNLFEWEAVVFGPKDSIWEDARFRVSLTFSEEYPNQAPVVQFVSRVYHPNVYSDGTICVDILDESWLPSNGVRGILLGLLTLLLEPNPNSAANSDAGGLCEWDKNEYERKVRNCVEES
jgi:ubiquitin-conjugating enzyme E2 A